VLEKVAFNMASPLSGHTTNTGKRHGRTLVKMWFFFAYFHHPGKKYTQNNKCKQYWADSLLGKSYQILVSWSFSGRPMGDKKTVLTNGPVFVPLCTISHCIVISQRGDNVNKQPSNTTTCREQQWKLSLLKLLQLNVTWQYTATWVYIISSPQCRDCT